MSKNIKELLNEYRYSRKIKRFSLNHNNNVFFRTIISKDQIAEYQSRAFGSFGVVEKNYPLHEEDLEYFEDAIKEFEICISKCIAMNDNIIISEDWRVSGEELEGYIVKLLELYKLYDRLAQKKLFQD